MKGDLLVDIHQPGPIKDSLSKNPTCLLQELRTGDYMWESDTNKLIMVESKTSTDLVASLSCGRLQDQVARLITDCDIPVLLISGVVMRDYKGTTLAETDLDSPYNVRSMRGPWKVIDKRYTEVNLTATAVNNFLLTCQTAGVIIDYIHGVDNRHVIEANRVRELIAYYDKPEHVSIRRRDMALPIEPNAEQLTILRSLPGVSDILAKRILASFHTVYEFLSATPDEMCKVEGIGKRKANAIFLSIHMKGE